jgi:hypothetical protein
MLRIGGQKVPTPLILLVAIDCICIALGLALAVLVRFGVAGRAPILHYLLAWRTFFRFLTTILICEIALYFNDLYDFRLLTTRREIFVRLLQGFGVACF